MSCGSVSIISTHLRYADPITLAGALAIALKRSALGFAVLQTSLHHPIRLAEQLAIIDNLTKGKLIVGLGRGSSYNIYDYQGFGIDHHEAQARLDEAEPSSVKAWTRRLPAPRPFLAVGRADVPPASLYEALSAADARGSSGDASLVELARQGKPFLMNVHPSRRRERGRTVFADDARGGVRRRDDRRQSRGELGVAQHLRRRDRCRGRAHRAGRPSTR